MNENDCLVKIRDERNVFRDINSNAILFTDLDDTYAKKRKFMEMNANRINNLEEKMQELEKKMKEITMLLSHKGMTNVL
jgi:hypothetical protein